LLLSKVWSSTKEARYCKLVLRHMALTWIAVELVTAHWHAK